MWSRNHGQEERGHGEEHDRGKPTVLSTRLLAVAIGFAATLLVGQVLFFDSSASAAMSPAATAIQIRRLCLRQGITNPTVIPGKAACALRQG